ncbi:MAG: sulfite exporter TauE/SafE family protein [Chitinispirillales bacterium]|jgi:sulfite exporter TauE/SafE/plastocyanin domain-containing protein/copper chaperone CopZ|nr:sulfite exporter TauE/SafE family protein [Chitinispirillales bacterium]
MTAEAEGQKKTAAIRVAGMFCHGCADTIRTKLRAVKGVSEAAVNYNKGTAVVTYAPGAVTFDEICAAINALGYEALGEYVAADGPRTDWRRAAGMIIIIAAVYIVLQQYGLLKMLLPRQLAASADAIDMSYGLIFLVGLATSVHCVAMCGGINLSQCLKTGGAVGTKPAKGERLSFLWPSLKYNTGRLISYTAIGAIAGAVGSAITFSINTRGALNLIAGVFMVIMGVGMLDIFPQMRRFIPKMPKFVYRWSGAGASSRGPLIVGLLNGFLPCGPLQAMQFFALSTGSPLKGGLAMGIFSLGTVPLMFGLGTFGSFAGRASRRVMTAGAVMVAVLGLCMLSQSWNLFGLPSGGMPLAAVPAPPDSGNSPGSLITERGHLLVNSTLLPYTYPSITVEAGRPVRWEIDAKPHNINGCNNRIFIREYGIEHEFKPGKNVIEFTPNRVGKVPYTCWMGMIPGLITVVAGGKDANQADQNYAPNQSRGGATAPPPIVTQTPAAPAIDTGKFGIDRGPLLVNSTLQPRSAYPSITVEVGRPVRWEIEASPFSLNACNNKIIIPEYNIEYAFKPGKNVIEFTPTRKGRFQYTCWMGMIPGMITVVDSVKAKPNN